MITAELLLTWNACWTAEEIHKFAGSQGVDPLSGLSPRDVTRADAIHVGDRAWVLCCALEYRRPTAAHALAVGDAGRVSHLAGDGHHQADHGRLLEDLQRIYSSPTDSGPDLERWRNDWQVAYTGVPSYRNLIRNAALYAAQHWAWHAVKNAGYVVGSRRLPAVPNVFIVSRCVANALSALDDRDLVEAAWDASMELSMWAALAALGPDSDGWR